MTAFLEHDAVRHSTAFLLPIAALQRVKDGFVVFKQNEPGEYEQVTVQLLEQSREFAEVTGALAVGDHVVVSDVFVLKSEAGKAHMGEGHQH